MVRRALLTGAHPVDRRGFLALAATGGVVVAGGARLLVPQAVPEQAWRPGSWSGLLGQRLRLAQGGAVRLLQVADRSTAGGTRFSLLLEPLAGGVAEGLHTVLHPRLGPVELGATSVGRSGRLLVVVDRTSVPSRENRHV